MLTTFNMSFEAVLVDGNKLSLKMNEKQATFVNNFRCFGLKFMHFILDNFLSNSFRKLNKRVNGVLRD